MRRIFKISVVFILVLSMIVSIGLSSYTAGLDDNYNPIDEESNIGQDEQVQDSNEQQGDSGEQPVSPEDTPTDLENSEETPVDPESPEEQPVNQENPPVDSNTPTIIPVPPVTPIVNPSIYVEVSTDKDSYLAGEAVNYTIKVINTGNVGLENVTLEDGLLGQKTIGNLGIGEEQLFNEEYWIQKDYSEEILSNFISVVGYYGEIEVIGGSGFEVSVEMSQKGTLSYVVKYFVDDEEQIEWEINDQVPVDNPIVEIVPHDYMPEGYMVDEELSTVLPFVVTEENIIFVYYIQQQLRSMGLAASGYYYSENGGVVVKTVLQGQSVNTHSIPELVWLKDGIVHAAVKSTHGLQYMTLNGITSSVFDEYGPLAFIYVDDIKYDPKTGLQGNIKDSHWTVFKFNLTDLPIPNDGRLDFFIKGIGGGHDVGGYMTVIVPKEDIVGYKEWVGGGDWPSVTLKLKRQVGFGAVETASIGIVDGIIDSNETTPWSYTWLQMPKYNPYGQPYIYSIDEEEVPQYYEKTIRGMTVINTFTPPGELTITKYVSGSGYDPNQEFNIFITGSNGKEYVVTLRDKESITITDLEYGLYTLREIVPMNYKLAGMSDYQITIDRENNIKSVDVYNERTNDGWFYDDDEEINSFTVGGGSQSSLPLGGRTLYSKLEYFLVPAALEIDFRGDNT